MDIAGLSFRTFAHATEDEEKVEQALKLASGADEITRSKSEGYHGNPIVVMEAKISRSKEIKEFFASLPVEDVQRLLDTLEIRIDEESMFFLRLDKQAAFEGRLTLGRNDDVISVRGKIKSYPQSRENALKTMGSILQDVLDRRAHKD
jgi:RNA binding exosome subunit